MAKKIMGNLLSVEEMKNKYALSSEDKENIKKNKND